MAQVKTWLCLGFRYFGKAPQQNIKSNSSKRYSEHKTQKVDVCNTGEYHPPVTSLMVVCFRLQDLRLNSFQKMLMLWVPWSCVDQMPPVRLTHHLSRTIHNAQCTTHHLSLSANRWWAAGKSISLNMKRQKEIREVIQEENCPYRVPSSKLKTHSVPLLVKCPSQALSFSSLLLGLFQSIVNSDYRILALYFHLCFSLSLTGNDTYVSTM